MTGYMRLWNPDWYSTAIAEDEVRRKDVHHKYPMTFDIQHYAEVSAAATQIGAAANAVFYGGRVEVCTITCTAANDYTTGQYFLLYESDGDGTETVHYVWFNLDGGGGDPSGGASGLECAITTDETSTQVAVIVAAAIDGEGGLTATSAVAVVTAESDNVGNQTDVADVDSGCTCVTTYQGAYHQSAKLFVISAQANDTDALTGDARKVRIIGLSVASKQAEINGTEIPQYTVEEVNLAGTTAVQTARYYQRVMHMYCCDWGSGGTDAKGDITLEDAATGTGNVYLTITATFNESNNGGMIYVGAGYYGRWKRLLAGLKDTMIREAAPDAGGIIAIVKSGFDDILNVDPDMQGIGYIFDWYHPLIDVEPECFRSKGTEAASITFNEQRVGDKAETIQALILYEIQTSA